MTEPEDHPNPLPCHVRDVELFGRIDFAKLELPSGDVTVNHLRKLYPKQHECLEEIFQQDQYRLDAMYDEERLFVLLGYGSVLGKEAEKEVYRAVCDNDKERLVREYTNNLVYYGQADGQETAKQIIRRLEETGAAIARDQLGRLPG